MNKCILLLISLIILLVIYFILKNKNKESFQNPTRLEQQKIDCSWDNSGKFKTLVDTNFGRIIGDDPLQKINNIVDNECKENVSVTVPIEVQPEPEDVILTQSDQYNILYMYIIIILSDITSSIDDFNFDQDDTKTKIQDKLNDAKGKIEGKYLNINNIDNIDNIDNEIILIKGLCRLYKKLKDDKIFNKFNCKYFTYLYNTYPNAYNIFGNYYNNDNSFNDEKGILNTFFKNETINETYTFPKEQRNIINKNLYHSFIYELSKIKKCNTHPEFNDNNKYLLPDNIVFLENIPYNEKQCDQIGEDECKLYTDYCSFSNGVCSSSGEKLIPKTCYGFENEEMCNLQHDELGLDCEWDNVNNVCDYKKCHIDNRNEVYKKCSDINVSECDEDKECKIVFKPKDLCSVNNDKDNCEGNDGCSWDANIEQCYGKDDCSKLTRDDCANNLGCSFDDDINKCRGDIVSENKCVPKESNECLNYKHCKEVNFELKDDNKCSEILEQQSCKDPCLWITNNDGTGKCDSKYSGKFCYDTMRNGYEKPCGLYNENNCNSNDKCEYNTLSETCEDIVGVDGNIYNEVCQNKLHTDDGELIHEKENYNLLKDRCENNDINDRCKYLGYDDYDNPTNYQSCVDKNLITDSFYSCSNIKDQDRCDKSTIEIENNPLVGNLENNYIKCFWQDNRCHSGNGKFYNENNTQQVLLDSINCDRFMSEEYCPKSHCYWKNSKCLKKLDCSNFNDEETCNIDSCSWNNENQECKFKENFTNYNKNIEEFTNKNNIEEFTDFDGKINCDLINNELECKNFLCDWDGDKCGFKNKKGCLNHNTKDACLRDNYNNELESNICKWIDRDGHNGICVDNELEVPCKDYNVESCPIYEKRDIYGNIVCSRMCKIDTINGDEKCVEKNPPYPDNQKCNNKNEPFRNDPNKKIEYNCRFKNEADCNDDRCQFVPGKGCFSINEIPCSLKSSDNCEIIKNPDICRKNARGNCESNLIDPESKTDAIKGYVENKNGILQKIINSNNECSDIITVHNENKIKNNISLTGSFSYNDILPKNNQWFKTKINFDLLKYYLPIEDVTKLLTLDGLNKELQNKIITIVPYVDCPNSYCDQGSKLLEKCYQNELTSEQIKLLNYNVTDYINTPKNTYKILDVKKEGDNYMFKIDKDLLINSLCKSKDSLKFFWIVENISKNELLQSKEILQTHLSDIDIDNYIKSYRSDLFNVIRGFIE